MDLPQFEKVIPTRKNEKHPVLKEEEKIINGLKEHLDNGKIDETLYDKLKPMGSQPARYGLAKVHKNDVPMRPVLSMPGSAYHKIATQVTKWLSVVDECNIRSSTKKVCDMLSDITLDDDEVLVSFDVTSLYTNVPVQEAIDYCTGLLYSGRYDKPPIAKDTFKTLLQMCCKDVLMLTPDGYYRQIDGLAMGSPPAPLLSNGWLSQHDDEIRGDAKLFSRYMDDIIQSIKRNRIYEKLAEINEIPSLTFTMERESEGCIPFLDMKIIRSQNKLSSTWYYKPSDTGLIMNYHALAPKKYKKSVVSGFVHRLYRSCSTWKNFHSSLEKAKRILEKNQYPPSFFEPIVHSTLQQILVPKEPSTEEESETKEVSKKLLFVQYRGKVTENYERSLKKCNAPCTVVMTLRKVKSVMPSLKPQVDKSLRSGVVYQIICSRCQSCYVGQTGRHLITRFKEHMGKSAAMKKHLIRCDSVIDFYSDNVKILASSTRSTDYLETLEALWIREIKPTINTKDEYRRKTLTIKI